jgi:hypothetical protein
MFTYLLFFIILYGCVLVKNTYTSNGELGYSLNCSGSALNWPRCYEKAGNLCGTNGCGVVEKSGEQGSIASANMYNAFAMMTYNRSMVVKCKVPK